MKTYQTQRNVSLALLIFALSAIYPCKAGAQNTLYALTGDGKLLTISTSSAKATQVRAPLAPLPASTWYSGFAINNDGFFATYSFRSFDPRVVQFGTSEGDEIDLGTFNTSGTVNINSLAKAPDGAIYAPVYRRSGSNVYLNLTLVDIDNQTLDLHIGNSSYEMFLGTTSDASLSNIDGTFNGLAWSTSTKRYVVWSQYWGTYTPILGHTYSGNLPTVFVVTGSTSLGVSTNKVLIDSNYNPVLTRYVRGIAPTPSGAGFYYVVADPESPIGEGSKLYWFDPESFSSPLRSTLIGNIPGAANITGIAFGFG